ncbi:MAG: prepilin-type N-terminal cleavage/methylation domain-containing protein [Candidatus Omnitrophica bacterium]|nr:prepilin-type N-terminal cleavage/methylation domain-containing protein [Candidatus Omnitrophota bacterium]
MRIFGRNGAFTFIELIFVVVIVGILAALAVPRFSDTVEKSRSAEAINILETLRNAQAVYNLENGVYTATIGDLDVTIPVSKNFVAPTTAAANPISSIRRNASGYDYTLTIDIDGTVRCAGTAPANICAKLGCPGDVCN